MFCKNCGNKIEEGSKFCSSCGNKNINNNEFPTEEREVLFYSQYWERIEKLGASFLPHFDILITEKFLYLIPLPLDFSKARKNVSRVFGSGVLFGALGGLVSSALEPNGGAAKSLYDFRSSWLDSNRKVISSELNKKASFKVSKEKFKSNISFKNIPNKKIVSFMFDNGEVTLCNEYEYDKFKNYIDSYTL